MLWSSPVFISALLIFTTNFPATFLARLLSLVEVRVGDGVDVLGVGVEPAPDRRACLSLVSRFLGLVAFPFAGGSSDAVIVGFV